MKPLPQALNDWVEAGLIDRDTAGRIGAFEARQAQADRPRWTSWLALGLGVCLVASGLLLFVAANWDEMLPGLRFVLTLSMVGLLHGLGTLTTVRSPNFSRAMHGLGTLSLGPAIYLSAQIFHLQEHWPTGVLVWTVGALAGVMLLEDWVQTTLAAVIAPAWLASEWLARDETPGRGLLLATAIFFVTLTYLGAVHQSGPTLFRRALMWIGVVAFGPVLTVLVVLAHHSRRTVDAASLVQFALLLLPPLALAWRLRGREAWAPVAGLVWALLPLGLVGHWPTLYAWLAVGAVALTWWGVHEARSERVNLGLVTFGVTLVAFYFSSVMDKLGRSMGLIGLGALFLAGGWQLERLRRRLAAHVADRTSGEGARS